MCRDKGYDHADTRQTAYTMIRAALAWPGAAFSFVFLSLLIAVSPWACSQAAGPGTPVAIKVGLIDIDAVGNRTPGGVEVVALRRILQTLGIQFDILVDTKRLPDYRVVYTAGPLLYTTVAQAVADDLHDFVKGGGALVSAGEVGRGFYDLFGVNKQEPSRGRYRLSFSGNDPALAYIDDPRERTISLGNRASHFYDEVIWSHGATLESDALALGFFEDGSAGFSVHSSGKGTAYLLGMSYTESVLRPQAGASYNAERQYANGIEPSADVIMLILKAVYEAAYPVSLCTSPVPYAMTTALVLTHDVDTQTSFLDSLKFAALEQRLGVTSTFFITTKYFKDPKDIGYFNIPANVDAIRKLKAMGWDIGSNAVFHGAALGKAPDGDPSVTQKTYDPLKEITVWGELRVSKELLDAALPDQNTIAYRSGNLVFPRSLIGILQQAGYKYDSTYSANAVLTAFPYFAFERQFVGQAESRVVEIPVSLDESQGYLTPSNVSAVVKNWISVIRANAHYQGTTVLLMHTSDTRTLDYKLRAQEALIKAVTAMGGWVGDLSTVGKFWLDRSRLQVEAEASKDGGLILLLNTADKDLNPALGFAVRGKFTKVSVVDKDGKVLAFDQSRRAETLHLRRTPAPWWDSILKSTRKKGS